MKERIRIFLITLCTLTLALVLLYTPAGEYFIKRAEYSVQDFWNYLYCLTGLTKKPSVVIIGIDDQSFEKMGNPKWPWNHQVFAQALNNLRKYNKNLPVGIDIIFDTTSSVENKKNEHIIFAKSLNNAKNVILASAFSENAVQHNGSLVKPVEILAENASGTAVISLQHCIDGSIRSLPFVFEPQTETFAAIPFSVALYTADFGIKKITLSQDKQTVLIGDSLSIPVEPSSQSESVYFANARFFPHRFIPTIPFYKIFLDELSSDEKNLLSRSVALIGPTSPIFHDSFLTPVYNGKQRPGVEIHAVFLCNLYEQLFYKNASYTENILFSILISSLIAALTITFSPFIIAAVFGCSAIFWFFCYYTVYAAYSFAGNYSLLLLFLCISTATAIIYKHFVIEKEKRAIRQAFSNYVNESVVDEIIKDPSKLKLGGQKREATVLFSDIQGFTTISEQLDAEELITLLNEYLGEMTTIILDHDGLLDKFIGDAIMAAWGAPVPQENAAQKACMAALRQTARLNELREKWETRSWPNISARIGINTGIMVIGNVGCEKRMDYTLMGDAVNLASRLESINKQYGTKICISEFTRTQLSGDFVVRTLDIVRVKGKNKPVKIFELAGMKDSVSQKNLEYIELFEKAFQNYSEQNFSNALTLFEQCRELNCSDQSAAVYIERCNSFINTPPPSDWDGVWTHTKK